MATVGRKIAIANFGRVKLKGFAGWFTWCLAHVYFLIGFRNRFVVALNWAWSYITFQRGSRLITGLHAPRVEDMRQHERMELHSKAS
jgi:NADH dehydrogenase